MADNDKNDDAEFDFGGTDWEDELESAEGKGKPAPADADPFGTAAFDDDDDDGVVFAEDEGADDAFAAAAKDPFADADDEPFAFQDMPTPGAIADAPVASGDPDEEFGDLGGGFAESDGFTGGDDLFDDDDHPQEKPVSDPFSDDEPLSDDDDDGFREDMPEEDPFGDVEDEGQDAYPAAAEAAPAASRPRRSFVKPLALAASVAFAGYVGYTFLLPMVMQPSVPEAPMPVAEAPAAPNFPTALPGQPGGLELSPAPISPSSPSVELPTVTGAPPVLAPAETAAPELPPVMANVPDSQPSLPPVMVPTEQNTVAMNPPTVLQPSPEVLPQPSKPAFDEFVGGEERGGIDAMKGEGGQPAAGIDAEALSGLEARIAAVETKVGQLADRIDAALSRPGALAAPALPLAPAAAPAAANLSGLVPPLKPQLVDGATLKGVSRGLAWISTPSGVVEVRKGDVVPNGGKVVAIRQYGGNWIVVTTDGIVVQ